MLTENSELDFIRAIQPAKKEQLDWAQLSYEQRQSAVRQWIENLKSNESFAGNKLSDILAFGKLDCRVIGKEDRNNLNVNESLSQHLSQDQTSLDSHQKNINSDQNELQKKNVAQLQIFSAAQVEKYELAPLWIQLEKLLSATIDPNSYPLGLFSLISPNFFAFRFVMEKIVPCLLAGNGVFVKVSRKNKIVAEVLQKSLQSLMQDSDLSAAKLPVGLIHIFCGDEALGELLVTHPVIQAVIFSGKSTTAEMVIGKAVAGMKRLQVHSAYHNSALLMRELTEQDIEQLATACLLSGGRLPWNVNNILLLESHLENFKNIFLPVIQSWPKQIFPATEYQCLLDLQKNLQKEKAKQLLSMSVDLVDGHVEVSPAVIQDLTHCSTLYQDCLGAPVIFLSPVKYTHEMVRWTNNSYYGQCALLFASDEQVQKFSPRLEVAQIFANHWLPTEASWLPGWKQSFYGVNDQQISGSFFSQRQKICSLHNFSKNISQGNC